MDDRTPELPLSEAESGMQTRTSTAAPKTYEERVQTKLTIIAWSVGVLAALSVLSTIGSLVALGTVASH